jgi:hypothetical protein
LGLALARGLPEYLGTTETIFLNRVMEGNRTSGWAVNSVGPAFTPAGRPLGHRLSYWLGHIPYWAGPCLVVWSVGVLVLGIRSRLPADLPGPAAALAVAAAFALNVLRPLQYATATGSIYNALKYNIPYILYFWVSLPRQAGYTVAIWWLALRLGGRWSAGASATERLGRALGWCWIAMAVSSEASVWLLAVIC